MWPSYQEQDNHEVIFQMQQQHLSIDSKNANFVHVWKLRNHQNGHCKCIQEQYRLLIVGCMRGYQVPEQSQKAKHKIWKEMTNIYFIKYESLFTQNGPVDQISRT